ncbi:Methyltransferase-like protein [Novymonas esmeraldas]|uniref:Methyltransferase-like protein n=1 Tax=Novymonas esmeraldas TaxID=1808958 RepID=A0AAW0EXX4_9TRYP
MIGGAGRGADVLIGACNDPKYATVGALRERVLLDGRYEWQDLPFSCPSSRHVMLARRRGASAGGGTLEDGGLGALLESDSIPQYVWPAAGPMCEWVSANSSVFVGKTVLELGCGTGVLGFTVAQHASLVVLTDSSPVSLALALESVARNRYHNCRVAALQWGRDDHLRQIKQECGVDVFDLVIGSDVFYFSNTLRAGLATAHRALTPPHGADSVFLCGSVARSDRMEYDLEEMPVQEGFALAGSLVQDPFRLYMWRPHCPP